VCCGVIVYMRRDDRAPKLIAGAFAPPWGKRARTMTNHWPLHPTNALSRESTFDIFRMHLQVLTAIRAKRTLI
jgi:hypothetical protein